MDRGSAFGQTCSCGRTFSHLGAFRNHQNTCKQSKKILSNALAKAKEVMAARKQNRTVSDMTIDVTNNDDQQAQLPSNHVPQHSDTVPSETNAQLDDVRPTKRPRQLPPRFRVAGLEMHDRKLRDILPQAPPALPPDAVAIATPDPAPPNPPPPPAREQDDAATHRVRASLRRVLETAKNSFGIFRRYYAEKFPSHDPEGESDLLTMSNIVGSGSRHSPPDENFFPYPNKSSFRLGEWYWNRGKQKSQQDFKELLDVVGDEDFQPAEVRATHWKKINDRLALNDWDKDEWVDEDAGWRSSPVKISVPFDRNTSNPGLQDYVIEKFHYRPLMSVIREKVSRQCDDSQFHYEPYTLLWQPSGDRAEIRLHGELYTSPAFIDAHNALQDSPPEPNCELPRIVVALMFWSDSTHLTNFGNTKLWPLYMFFGNESKYRRCKPSSNLCEHVAYFERVYLLYLVLRALC
jgi:Plavaka transposase